MNMELRTPIPRLVNVFFAIRKSPVRPPTEITGRLARISPDLPTVKTECVSTAAALARNQACKFFA
jgi:hypothetical protein